MTSIKAVFLDLATVDCGDLDLSPLKRLGVYWTFYQTTAGVEIIKRVHDADLLVTNKVVLDRTLLQNLSALRLISIAATGTNHVDLDAAHELGMAVTHVTRYATASVVQHVFSLILALTTHLNDYQRSVSEGAWQKSNHFCLLEFPINELSGKTLGVVGYGELGQAVARIAQAFGMRILIAQRPGGPAQKGRLPLHELLPRVDVLTLHCPLAENTRNLIGERELALMKPNALLINTARGGIIDEAALALALRQGSIGGAGVDVLSAEPPKPSNPLLETNIPHLLVTPHIAWASHESRQRLIDEIAWNIKAFFQNESRNRVV